MMKWSLVASVVLWASRPGRCDSAFTLGFDRKTGKDYGIGSPLTHPGP